MLSLTIRADMLDPAIKGTTEILEAAAKHERVKRVVLTSRSVGARALRTRRPI